MLLVILDGAGDRKNRVLGNTTPLEAARMANLNKIAVKCVAGMMYSIGKGIAPESDSAVFSILGYNTGDYTGRGPIEAYGAGIDVKKNTLALRANFATVNEKMEIIDRRAGRNISKAEAKALEKELNRIKLPGARIRFKSTVGHRGVLVINSSKISLSSNISNADIGYTRHGNISIAKSSAGNKFRFAAPLDSKKESKTTADLVNLFLSEAMRVLKNSAVNIRRRKKGLMEVNAVLLRDAGIGLPKVEPIQKKFGLKSAFVAEMPVETGIAKLLGMSQLRVNGIGTKYYYKNLASIVKSNIRKYDLVYVHIKGPDEPGHDGNARLKTEILKRIDSEFFSKINGIANVMCVTADHSTPCTIKAHSADPVPVLVCCKRGVKGGGDGLEFNEEIRAKGSLGIFDGPELINKMLGVSYGCDKVNKA